MNVRLAAQCRFVPVNSDVERYSLDRKSSMNAILEKVSAIEGEMRRIGYWSGAAPTLDATKLYAGVSFEEWLQFLFLPSVSAAAQSGDFGQIPPYRVGLAALRQYDYHSVVEEAHPLMRLCQELEKLLAAGGEEHA